MGKFAVFIIALCHISCFEKKQHSNNISAFISQEQNATELEKRKSVFEMVFVKGGSFTMGVIMLMMVAVLN